MLLIWSPSSLAGMDEFPGEKHWHTESYYSSREKMRTDEMASLDLSLSVLGGFVVLWFLLKSCWVLGRLVRVHLLSEVWKGVDLSHYGTWAVVTGSTSGIGKYYAFELAKRGLDVVLISRSMEKLKQVATEIEEHYGQRTKVIQADFTGGSEIYAPIQAALQGLEIGILVNNVGMNPEFPKEFLQIPDVDKHVSDLVNCNVLSAMKMTQTVLPQMVARKKGIVINISSANGRRPFPLDLIYSATKASADFFSRALDAEYRSKGILVQSILPMFVDTKMTSRVTNQFLKMSPKAYARQALNTVGLTNRTAGCLSHALQYFVFDLVFPLWFQSTSLGYCLYRLVAKATSK